MSKPLSPLSAVVEQAVRGLKASSLTPQHGSTGNGGSMSLTPEDARARLVASSPTEVDQGLRQWLMSSLGAEPRMERDLRYPVSGGYYSITTGCTLAGLTPENAPKAVEMIRAAMTPPEIGQAEEWITALHLATAHRGAGEAGLETILNLYAGCLARYPADIAKAVCMKFALRREKPNWFPTLSELDEAAETMTKDRQVMLDAARRLAA
jgi:hypothetical protein